MYDFASFISIWNSCWLGFYFGRQSAEACIVCHSCFAKCRGCVAGYKKKACLAEMRGDV